MCNQVEVVYMNDIINLFMIYFLYKLKSYDIRSIFVQIFMKDWLDSIEYLYIVHTPNLVIICTWSKIKSGLIIYFIFFRYEDNRYRGIINRNERNSCNFFIVHLCASCYWICTLWAKMHLPTNYKAIIKPYCMQKKSRFISIKN